MKKSLIPVYSCYLSCQLLLPEERKSFLVVSYNVENLFDTINAPEFEDDEFTPRGERNGPMNAMRKN